MIFLYDSIHDEHECIRACKETMLLAQTAGITSLNIACSDWMTHTCNPLAIASNLGLRAVQQSLESLCSFNLAMKSLSGVENIITNVSRYSSEIYSNGLTSAILPGLLESFFASPLILTKFYTFLHAGYSWNRQACITHFETNTDISLLKDTVRMVLFPTQFYSRLNTSDAFLNTGVILNLLSNATTTITTLANTNINNTVVHTSTSTLASKLHTTENVLWCLLNSFDDVNAMEVPPKDLVGECLRNYKRCLSSSKWKLGKSTFN
jgi:hypothetical protein